MPSTQTIALHSDGDLAWYTHTTDDPRRNGRVDLALFPSIYTQILCTKKVAFKHGEFYADDVSFSRFFAACYNQHMRIESNCDYCPRNYTRRDRPANAPRLRGGSSPKTKNIDYHTRLPFNSKSEWVALTVKCQANITVQIKINKYLVQYVPKRMFLPKGKNGLYFTGGDPARYYNDRHGTSLALHLLQKIGVEAISGHHLHRTDVFDYRIDISSNEYISTEIVKNHYIELDNDETVLQIDYDTQNLAPWDAITSGESWRFPGSKTESNKRIIYILLNSSFVPELKDYRWKYDDVSRDIYAKDFDGKTVLLKRLVAQWSGMDIGETIIASRITAVYKKALDSGEKGYKVRAKYDNAGFDEMQGGFRRYTNPKHLKYRHVAANKKAFWHFGEALDLRAESLSKS